MKFNLHKKFIFIVVSFFIGIVTAFPQMSWKYMKPEQKYKVYFTPIPSEALDITSYLPKNFVKDKSADYTEILQKAIDENKIVLLPNFPVKIGKTGLRIPSDRKIYFNKKSEIYFDSDAKGRLDDAIKIYDVENVSIYNANVKGNRKENKKQQGEWSAGIAILNSKNILIQNFIIADTWGDGLFVGSEDLKYSQDITIKNGVIDNARRNGISITSVRNALLSEINISNTNGTAPQCGIDIEPSVAEEILDNVYLSNIFTYNNANAGLNINLNALSVLDIRNRKYVSILIDNHIDNYSYGGFSTSLNVYNKYYDAGGVIRVQNSDWTKAKIPFSRTSNSATVKIYYKNIYHIDEKGNNKFKKLASDRNVFIEK